MPAINAHGEFTPTPENHITPRPHPDRATLWASHGTETEGQATKED